MPLHIVRNDITKMDTTAIVNTANDHPTVGSGCDRAVYRAAGMEALLTYRTLKIGYVPEGEVFLSPGFNLKQEYIIHAVSPRYIDGLHGEKQCLRSCYHKALMLAWKKKIDSIAFPLISTGSFGFPKEEGARIAFDEIKKFLEHHDMLVYLVVFDEEGTKIGKELYSDLAEYIDQNYVNEQTEKEYRINRNYREPISRTEKRKFHEENFSFDEVSQSVVCASQKPRLAPIVPSAECVMCSLSEDEIGRQIKERMKHMKDSFSQYLMYLIKEKGLKNADVYNNAWIDRKVFSKIKNDINYHPQKITALCLCIGAKLNRDESLDLLSRAGYTISYSDKTDVIFSYFIENEIYDIVEISIVLEEYGIDAIEP